MRAGAIRGLFSGWEAIDEHGIKLVVLRHLRIGGWLDVQDDCWKVNSP